MAAQVTPGLRDVGMPKLGSGRGSGIRPEGEEDRADGDAKSKPQDLRQGPHTLSTEVGAPRSAGQPGGILRPRSLGGAQQEAPEAQPSMS